MACGPFSFMAKKADILESVGHELKQNPPRILAHTARKFGKEDAKKQRVAILLSKARKAGANIPKKGLSHG
jgi:hypothetical protein